jgi:CRP-like cAMP-binding protein
MIVFAGSRFGVPDEATGVAGMPAGGVCAACFELQNTHTNALSGMSLLQFEHFFTRNLPARVYRHPAGVVRRRGKKRSGRGAELPRSSIVWAMATLGEVKGHARRLFLRGDAMHALRLYDSIVAAAPLDVDSRVKMGDCFAALGQKPAAVETYRAAAWFCLKAGHPLDGIVCARLVETVGGSCDDLLSAIVAMYGNGSDLLGKLAARVAPPSDDTPVNPPELRNPPSPTFIPEAAGRAIHCLDNYDEYPEALHPIPLLSDLSDQNLRRVLGAILIKRLPDGAAVIREGEPGESFFMLANGVVRVFNTDALGRETELARLSEGALFGEMALLGSQPRSASVAVVGEADLIEIGRTALSQIANELQQVAAALDRFTRERLLKNLVATSPLFRPFSRVQQLDLLRRFTGHDVAAGTAIIREGDEGRGLFVVLNGEVEVQKKDETGKPIPIATLRAGELFGEIALVKGTPATATVLASRQSTVLFLGRDYFDRLVGAVPEVKRYFEELTEERLMSNQLLLADDQIVEEDERVLV